MPDEIMKEPWEEIEDIVAAQDAEYLDDYLQKLNPAEVARAISRLDEETQAGVLTLLEPEDAADLIEELPEIQGADIIEDLPVEKAALIVDEMESDVRADLLQELHEDDAEAILAQMDPQEAANARRLLAYEADTAGGIMITEFLAYDMNTTIAEVLEDLHKHVEAYSDLNIQYIYVVNEKYSLVGVIPLRNLILSKPDKDLVNVMITNPLYVLVDTSLDELEQIFDRYPFIGIPVTDKEGRLVGVAQQSDVEEALGEIAADALNSFSGIIGGDELRSMPVLPRAVRRMSVLSFNLVLSAIAASVILHFETTIGQMTTLAFFIPIIGNMSGCSGNQAVGVSIRELALGITRPEDWKRVLLKEVQVGLINGVLLGIFLSAVALLLHKGPIIGLVAGGALAFNSVFALCIGGVVPLMLRTLGIDPALAAPPILTSLTDMCGFLIFLSLATWLLI
ncbi:MAG TPA: magnesium transporter [Candidatus Hydrogenedentes bacterium]|nr:magnesium transporter [Candidatus Hydrogenedentota bacterium]HQE84239.1 magnesium transporter [Candidatus Hydrogenedentota bacterium]HQH51071.1 magnesium transporter [Candidatus Hydrogenedentota bacterium]HQM47687.1 magnesium transporter [Candidatus Hydrogenedentota bacterium]